MTAIKATTETEMNRFADLLANTDANKITTAELVREISMLKELVFLRMDSTDKEIEHIAKLLVEKADTREYLLLKEYFLSFNEEHNGRHERTETHLELLRASQRETLHVSIVGVEKLLQASITASQEAIGKVEMTTDRRFESVNEFRATLTAQQVSLITRLEVEALLKNLTARVTDLSDRMNTSVGKGLGLNQGWVYLIAAVTAICATIGAGGVLLTIWSVLSGHGPLTLGH